MIPILLATNLISGTLSCSEAQGLVENLRKNPRNGPEIKEELISVIKDSSKPGCWDATVD